MENKSTESLSNLLYLLIGILVWVPLIVVTISRPPAVVNFESTSSVQPAAAVATSAPTSAAQAATPASAAGDAEKGKVLFASTCAACHGPTAEGVKGLGKDLTTSEFIAGLSDEELLAFVKKGRDMSDPLNTTGIAMPPKGGNPALQDEQITDIIAFIRSIHK